MKTFFLSLIILSGAMAQAQPANSQASQVITLRLQPLSMIDFSAVTTGKPARQTDDMQALAASASMREIIINKSLSADAALPTAAVQNEEKNNSHNMMAYNTPRPQRVYTFSSR